MARSRETKIELTAYDDLFQTDESREEAKLSKIRDIPISEIDEFPDHPFKVLMDEDMEQLVESIKRNGVMTPATVRLKEDGRYELISGHRRKKACELAGLETLKCEVKELSRDEAIIVMVESNLQRSVILPSEKAFAYKMRLEAMKRQAGRPPKENASLLATNLSKGRSDEELGELVGESKDQIRRYIRLTELVPEILQMVDERQIAFRPAVEVSYLTEEQQYTLLEAMEYNDATPSLAQAIKMKKYNQDGKLNSEVIQSIIEEEKPNQKEKPAFRDERITKLIPKTVPRGQETDFVVKALEFYNRHLQRKGALPYDTYIIEELRSDSNKGFELIPPFEIVVSRNNLVIDLGTLTDEYEKEISIHTTATSKDGEKTILAGKEVTIVDTVKLDGLTKGTKYQLKGWQMLKEENTELIIDGKRVENDYTFVADKEEMKVEISYTFNASALGGKNLVTFEELYDLSNPKEPVKVAEHKDIEDDGQTVLITERIIKIHTTATDKDGNKELEAGKEVTIVDTVTLEGLEVGTQYKLVGWQMLKEENAELLINGKHVESDYTFTADSETMKVEVTFTFDATSLDGKQLVTFEELYDLSNPDEPKKVTEHKDIEDEGQTITFKEKPEVPEEPEKPEIPQTPDTPHKTNSPKTGDSTNLYGLLALLMTSGAGLAGIFFYKRRKMKKS